MVQRVESLMLSASDRSTIVAALADEGVPARTTDDYIRRVRERWESTSEVERQFTRTRQLRRLYDQLRRADADGRHGDVMARERLIAQIEGNLVLEAERPARSGWDKLTDEQLKYITDHEGRLPPGVTAEDLCGP